MVVVVVVAEYVESIFDNEQVHLIPVLVLRICGADDR